MDQLKKIIGRNIVWLLIAVLVVGFFVIANQSDSEVVKNPDFIAAADDTDMFMGDKNAPVDLVVYTDFLCPYCAQFANDTMPEIEKEFVDTGKVKVETRPIAMIGVDSGLAAEGAYCAADQDSFKSYHDTLYAYAQSEIFDKNISTRETSVITKATLGDLMESADTLDQKAFSDCLEDDTYAAEVEKATANATAEGVSGTPYVMVNGNHVQGLSYDILSAVIKAQL